MVDEVRRAGDARGLALSPIQHRLVDAGGAIRGEAPARIDFLHSVLCQVGLPRRRTQERSFERRNGRVSVLAEAGSLFDGREFVEQPLPYGAIPRLVLIHLSSEAVRTQQRSIDVGSSMRQFLTQLGLQSCGGTRGGYRALRQQMEALAACRLTIGMFDEGRMVTVDAKPIKRFEAWLAGDGPQRALWPGVLELSEDFFDSLAQHAVPLDSRALAALKHSALALDVYSWLAHRLRRVTNPSGSRLSWTNIRDQFGREYRDPRNFKREFRMALRAVLSVYPDARLEEVCGGLVLHPSLPPLARTTVAMPHFNGLPVDISIDRRTYAR